MPLVKAQRCSLRSGTTLLRWGHTVFEVGTHVIGGSHIVGADNQRAALCLCLKRLFSDLNSVCPYLNMATGRVAVSETYVRHRAVEPSSGSNVIPRRARPGLADLGPPSPGVLVSYPLNLAGAYQVRGLSGVRGRVRAAGPT